MRHSSFLKSIEAPSGGRLCFHSLYGVGDLYHLFDPAYIKALDSFATPRDVVASDNQQIVGDLHAAGFLVPDDLSRSDERAAYDQDVADWLQSIVGGGHLDYLDLMVSEVCNFACGHCSRKFTYNPGGIKQGLMSWETAKKAIDYYWEVFSRSKKERADIHFGSDEPLLNWLVVKKCVEYIRCLGDNTAITINTNLSLLTLEMAQFFKRHNVDIISSLDGPRAGNNIVRVLNGGGKTFDSIVEKAELLKDIDYPLTGFITTILDKNWDYVDEKFIIWLVEHGYQSLAIDVDLVNSMEHSPRECVEKLTSLHEFATDCGLICGGAWMNPAKQLINGTADGMPAHCKSIKGKGISVTSDGHVQICSGCGVTLGHIDKMDDVFVENGVFHQLISAKMKTANTRCDGCILEAVCKNQCFMTDVGAGDNPTQRKKEMCFIQKETTKYLLQRHLENEVSSNN